MEITDEQIEFIRNDIRSRGVEIGSISDNLVDHICCAIEASGDTDFDTAYARVIHSFGENGILRVQEETVLLINIKKEEKMKKTMYLTGFIATFLSTMGLLFKFMHWPGANMSLMIGLLLVGFGFLPMYFYDKYKSSVS